MNIVLLIGTFGVGKDFLKQEAISRYPKVFAATPQVTTRPLREGELPSVTQHIEKEDFEKLIDGGKLLGYELIERTGNYYGTARDTLSNNKINIISCGAGRARSILDNKKENDKIVIVKVIADEMLRAARYLLREKNPDLDELMSRRKEQDGVDECFKYDIDPDIIYNNDYKRDPEGLFQDIEKLFSIDGKVSTVFLSS